MSNWKELSQQYIDAGFSVIPLIGKRALTSGWQKYNYELPEFPLSLSGQTGIGLCTGPASGIAAIDIDTDDKEILDLIPYSPVVRRGKKGEVRFYQYKKGIDSFKLDGHKIEIFSSSGQVVLPPSIHPDTKRPYEWTSKETLLTLNKEYLPELDLSFLSKLKEQKPILFEEKGRNNRLKDIVVSCLSRYESFDYAASEVYHNDKEYSTPRLFLDSSEGYRGESEDEAFRNACLFTSKIQTSLLQKNIISPIVPGSFEVIEVEEEEEEIKKEISIVSLPSFDSGLLGCIYKMIESSLEVRSANSISGASLAVLSSLVGHKYYLDDGSQYITTANDYFAFVKKSGSGKTVILSIIEEMIRACVGDAINYNFIGKQESGSSYFQSLESQSVNICNFDELSTILKQINTGRGDLEQAIMQTWEKASGTLMLPSSLTKKKENMKDTLTNAFVNIIAATTDSQFIEHSKKEMLNSGFYNRFLFFTDNKITQGDINLNVIKHDFSDFAELIRGTLYRKNQTIKPTKDYIELLQKVKIDDILSGQENKNESKSRRVSHAQKIALLLAISDDQGNPSVDADKLVSALQYVDMCLKNIDNLFIEIDSDNNYERDYQRVLKVLRDNPKGLSIGKLRNRVIPKSGHLFSPMLDRMVKDKIILASRGKRDNIVYSTRN